MSRETPVETHHPDTGAVVSSMPHPRTRRMTGELHDGLSGRSPDEIEALREGYLAQTGRMLESDVRSRFAGTHENELMALVLQGMSAQDKLQHFQTSDSIANVLENATPEELAEMRAVPGLLDTLREKMTDEGLLDARLRTFPEARTEAVLERIVGTNGWVNDDEVGAIEAFAHLGVDERRSLLDTHGGELRFLGSATLATMEAMASSEEEGLQARMTHATSGAGTRDLALPGLVGDTAALADEQRALLAARSAGVLDQAGTARLMAIGDVVGLLSPQRDARGRLRRDSFLGRMGGDVSDEQLHSAMAGMGVSPYEVAKQRILDAVGLRDDERALEEAFTDVPGPDRATLWADPHVQRSLTHLNEGEQARAAIFRDGDAVGMAEVRVNAANGYIYDDEAAMFEAALALQGEDRAAFRNSDTYDAALDTLDWVEGLAFKDAVRSGEVDIDDAIGASTSFWGANNGLMELLAGHVSETERASLRRDVLAFEESGGSWSHARRLDALSGFDGDDASRHLDALLDLGNAPRETPEQRLQLSELMNLRADQKMGVSGRGDGGLAALFSDTETTARESHQSQKSAYLNAVADEQVTAAELEGHALLWEQFGEDHAVMVEAQDAITEAMGMGLTVAAAIALTLTSLGAAGPAATAFMAKYGTLTTTGSLGAASLGSREVLGGDRYDLLGHDGRMDAALVAGEATALALGKGRRIRQLVTALQHRGPMPARPPGLEPENFVVRSNHFGQLDDPMARAFALAASQSSENAMMGIRAGEFGSAREILEVLASDRRVAAIATGDRNAMDFGASRAALLGNLTTNLDNPKYGMVLDRARALGDGKPVRGTTGDGRNVPLTRFDADGDRFVHTEGAHVPAVLDHVDELYASFARQPDLTPDQVVDAVAEMHWWLAHAAPYRRGSASVAGNFSRTLLAERGVNLGPTPPGVALDLEAMVTRDVTDFMAAYRGLHEPAVTP